MRLFERRDRSWFSAPVDICDHERHVFLVSAYESELGAIAREADGTEDAIENFCRCAAEHTDAIKRGDELVSFEDRDVVKRRRFALSSQSACRVRPSAMSHRVGRDLSR